MRKLIRKRVLIPIAAIAVLAVAGVAYAFFTSSGTGSGNGTVGTSADVTIDSVTVADTLYPGGQSSVSFTVSNPSTSTAVKVGSIVEDSVTGLNTGCLASDFSFDPVAINDEIPAGGSVSKTGTLHMANTSVSQDACKSSPLTLNLKVDNSGL